MDKDKILFLNFNCNWCPHFETELEIMFKLKNQGAEVFSLYCNGALNNYCISNKCNKVNHCKECINALKNGLDAIEINHSHRLKLEPVKKLEVPVFNSISELKKYTINDITPGFGAAASYMSITRDYLFNPADNKNDIDGLINAAYTICFNLEKIINKIKPDCIYVFNGRFAEYYPVYEICKKYNIDFCIHERGSSPKKYQVVKNDILHRFARYQEEIMQHWQNETDYEKKANIAEKWFHERRNKIEQNWVSFVADQETNRLPVNFDERKENIVIFNSSMDEYAVFDDWVNPIDRNDNNILKTIVEHYKTDKNKHFYLRIHPNLKKVNTTQIKELKEFALEKPENLTIIWPDETVDSYALMEKCKKIIVFISTMGIEATYWGKPAILAGKSFYDNLDCIYNATDYNTLFKLIDTDIAPKPKENCYPYIYWQSTYGIPFEKFEPQGLFNGTFMGNYIRRRRKNIFKRTFKKLISKFR